MSAERDLRKHLGQMPSCVLPYISQLFADATEAPIFISPFPATGHSTQKFRQWQGMKSTRHNKDEHPSKYTRSTSHDLFLFSLAFYPEKKTNSALKYTHKLNYKHQNKF